MEHYMKSSKLTPLYAAYLNWKTLEDLNPLIERTYQIVYTIIKRNKTIKVNEEAIIEEAIDVTSSMFKSNSKGKPIIIEYLEKYEYDDNSSLEFRIYKFVKKNIKIDPPLKVIHYPC